MTVVIQDKTDEEIKEYHLKRLEELSLKSQETLRDIQELEEPSYEQNQWVERRMRGPARSWESSIDHKPWILRWQYFVLGDYEQ